MIGETTKSSPEHNKKEKKFQEKWKYSLRVLFI